MCFGVGKYVALVVFFWIFAQLTVIVDNYVAELTVITVSI